MRFKYTGATFGLLPWSEYERIKAELEAEIQATKDTISELTGEVTQ